MEPPKGLLATLWSFICFLPFFVGLLLLGILKGLLLLPIVCLIMTVGNSAVILGLWPAHAVWTCYCIIRTQLLGPILKIMLLFATCTVLVVWPSIAIAGSILAGAAYGFLAPLVATFEAVGEGKANDLTHCVVDGTWTTLKGTFTAIRDFTDLCFHSYFSFMDDLCSQQPTNGKPYEIRLILLLGGFFIGLLGVVVDVPIITIIALCKSPFMLFKGWHRLFHDLIGREGPFLETACVPFAGLVIIIWPAAVVGSVIASILSSFFFGGYAAVITYQESSYKMGLSFIISSLSIFDEYTNDVLDLPEGSCIPRLRYRKNEPLHSGSFSRHSSFRPDKQEQKNPPSRSVSFKNAILELKPLKLLENLFAECKIHGEQLVAEGLITRSDIEECLSSSKEGGKVISIGLPAYCILQSLLRSAKANTDGLLMTDNTEVTSMNRPKDTIFEWFFDPLLIMKEQIRVEDLSEDEEKYLSKLVLLAGDPVRMKSLNVNSIILDERRRAEINALARRLQGITKSISRYPTVKRRFDILARSLSEELAGKIEGSQSTNGSRSTVRSKSAIARLFSQKSPLNGASHRGDTQEIQPASEKIPEDVL